MQTDLFASAPTQNRSLDLPAVLAQLATVSSRPRYAFMVLNLIARAADRSGSAGPYVHDQNRRVPVRDWLCDAMTPVAQRDPRRLALVGQVRDELAAAGALPDEADAAKSAIEDEVSARVRRSGKTAISRAVSDLVKAGLVTRYYQGHWVDHQNRGAQRQAVYSVPAEVRRAIAG